MAARLLSRSKTLSVARLFHPSSSLIDTGTPSSFSQCLRVPPPFIRPLCDSRSTVPVLDSAGAIPRNALVDCRKILVYEQISQSHPIKLVHAGTQGLPRWISGMAHGGTVTHLSNNITSQLCNSTEKNTTCNGKEGDCSKVIAFSPLEGSHLKERKSGLGNESSKIKRMELSQKITYALIPALLLMSKSTVTTSLLIFSIYWQIYGFFKEIFLDYVHQEVTRKWISIYFKLLLLILAKETILDFDMV
ncbi:succinate dehydrogenase subunit 4, mitochondrial isoform X3 [Elaeis guineensis]|uniref:Succinate dehydrogenase subunit 4, mitochondrial n=1 Tax=Elaeis guineensis var. tenera TaxID=51953 RepID=A0A6J0PI04_ELAGV|nr:succinate dehydrogenase subunit 4, mitochondrial [Elaeis guineensis]